ncbi:DUF2848 family protein [Micromonospora sp. NPDC005206]|uniref:DUF2848 family protein n=1 Tax=Micromonospora sp. NPDC005206 TaxID=3157022 RepID=UPI0033A81520
MPDTPLITLTVAGTADQIHLSDPRLVVAGYTGRDRQAVQAHIDELAHIGVTPPPRVPMFYELNADLLTTDASVDVAGDKTSGEVEPVLVFHGGRFYLGIGSDHTDRELETQSIAKSKAAAPKPMGAAVVPMVSIEERWDDIVVTCRTDRQPYQQGRLAAMLTPQQLLGKLEASGTKLTADTVMFCGTLPLLTGEFVYGTSYEMEMHLPDGQSLTHAYQVKHGSV